MENFWDYSVWSGLNLAAVLLMSLLAANVLKKTIKFLQASLIPASVLGGGILIVVAGLYKYFTGDVMYDTAFFGGNGTEALEIITYHTLALGFIASAFKPSATKMTKKRTVEIFNTGDHRLDIRSRRCSALQHLDSRGSGGLGLFLRRASCCPLATARAPARRSTGRHFENDFGFVGGKSFGLTIAALGFLSASIGGVIHLNIQAPGKIKLMKVEEKALRSEQIQSDDEIPMQESIDKLTIQIALIALAYLLAYLLMDALGLLLPSMKSVIYGFNFLLGVLTATLVKLLMGWLKKKRIIKKEYTNAFLMTRASNFFFDIMVVAGIAAIRFSVLKDYWGIILIMGVVGLVITYVYNYFVAKKLFPEYVEEQFLTMYGMLTGTASTGVILLREIDGEFKTPALD
ncbi:MAG: hypothetical protein ACLUEK_09320, partial [Oscillospiraceae bacterium]